MGLSVTQSHRQGRQPVARYLLRGLAIAGSFDMLAWTQRSSTATSSDIPFVPAAVLITAIMTVLQSKSWRLCTTALALGALSAQLLVGGIDGTWNCRCCVFISAGLCLLAAASLVDFIPVAMMDSCCALLVCWLALRAQLRGKPFQSCQHWVAALAVVTILYCVYWIVSWLIATRGRSVLRPNAKHAKALATAHRLLRQHTPVRSSMMCCSNPELLSAVAAAATPRHLEPVRIDRLLDTGSQPAQPSRRHHPPQHDDRQVSLEAYELARRLVSVTAVGEGAASTSTVARGDGAVGPSYPAAPAGAASYGYQSQTRKVRVSVKIPGRDPEDMPADWASSVQLAHQHQQQQQGGPDATQLVLFTYMRRGCIQLVLDVMELPHMQQQPQQQQPQQQRPHAGAAAAAATAANAPSEEPASAVGNNDGSGTNSSGEPGTDSQSPGQKLADRVPAQLDVLPAPLAHTLQVALDAGLLEACTVTAQHGSDIFQVVLPSTAAGAHSGSRGEGAAPGGSAGACLAAAPDLMAVVPVLCTTRQGGWWSRAWGARTAPQPLFLECVCVGTGAQGGATAAGRSAELQVTARQQGSFLPVAVAGEGPARRRHVPAASLLRSNGGATTASLSRAERPSGDGGGGGAPAVGKLFGRGEVLVPGDRVTVAVAPTRSEGLLQVEVSQDGVHGGAAQVLLVESRAVAFEMAQMALCGLMREQQQQQRRREQPPAEAGSSSSSSSNSGGTGGWRQEFLGLVQDFGVFLDLVTALSELGGPEQAHAVAQGVAARAPHSPPGRGACRLEPSSWGLEWSLLQAEPGNAPALVHACTGVTGEVQGSGWEEAQGEGEGEVQLGAQLRQLLIHKALVASCLGFHLLRHFLSAGMPACTQRVLHGLHMQLGVPPQLVTRYMCPDGTSLLHQAASSGSFGALWALAGWLDAHGCDPGWEVCAGHVAGGISPLHILAALPAARGKPLAALVFLRWPETRVAWYRGAGAGGGGDAVDSPAVFAAQMAVVDEGEAAGLDGGGGRGTGEALCAVLRVGAVAWAARLGVDRAWRGGEVLLWRHVPTWLTQWASGAVWPALAFPNLQLEAAYAEWWTQRWTPTFDDIFVGVNVVSCAAQAAKLGVHALLRHEAVLLFMATVRVAAHVLGWLDSSRPASGGASRVWCSRREARLLVVNLLRAVVMWAVAARLLAAPSSWVSLMRLRLDLVANGLMMPVAEQMRAAPYVLSMSVRGLGEVAMLSSFLCTPAAGLACCLAWAVCRSAAGHVLGLATTGALQARARWRFLLEEMRAMPGPAAPAEKRAC